MRRYLFLAILLIGISATITYSILVWDEPTPDITQELAGGSDKKEGSQVSLIAEPPVSLEKIEIELKVNRILNQIVLERVYTYCKHTLVEEINQSSPLLNLTKQEILGLYPGWSIKDEQSGRLVLQTKIEDLCPTDLTKRYVGEKGGFVTIFYGQPGMREKILKITDIPVDGFPLVLQENLRQGIVSESEDHLISFIDGLASFYWE